VGVRLGQLVAVALPVAICFFLLVALVLAVAEAVEVVPFVALPVVVALAVALLPPGLALLPPGLALLPPGLALLLAGLPLGPPLVLVLDGLSVPAGVALGIADVLAFGVAAGEELGGHAGGVGLGWPVDAPPRPPPSVSEPAWTPEPATLGGPPGLLEVIPTAEASWTNASCSGGTARAMPMANTAQASARAGRSSLSRQSREERRA
jgi:hypothetical protein